MMYFIGVFCIKIQQFIFFLFSTEKMLKHLITLSSLRRLATSGTASNAKTKRKK